MNGRTELDSPPSVFWACVVLGWGLIAVGVLGVLGVFDHFGGSVDWIRFSVWLVGLAVLHDLIVAPAVCLVGAVLASFLPSPYRAPVQGGLIVTAVLVLMFWPAVQGWGRLAGNPSIQPRDYGAALIWLIVGIWLAVAAVVVVARVRQRRPPTAR